MLYAPAVGILSPCARGGPSLSGAGTPAYEEPGTGVSDPHTQARSWGLTTASSWPPLSASFPGPQGVTSQPGGGDDVQLLAEGSDLAQTHSRPSGEHRWAQAPGADSPAPEQAARCTPSARPQLVLAVCFHTWQGGGLDPGAAVCSVPKDGAHHKMLQTSPDYIPECVSTCDTGGEVRCPRVGIYSLGGGCISSLCCLKQSPQACGGLKTTRTYYPAALEVRVLKRVSAGSNQGGGLEAAGEGAFPGQSPASSSTCSPAGAPPPRPDPEP